MKSSSRALLLLSLAAVCLVGLIARHIIEYVTRDHGGVWWIHTFEVAYFFFWVFGLLLAKSLLPVWRKAGLPSVSVLLAVGFVPLLLDAVGPGIVGSSWSFRYRFVTAMNCVYSLVGLPGLWLVDAVWGGPYLNHSHESIDFYLLRVASFVVFNIAGWLLILFVVRGLRLVRDRVSRRAPSSSATTDDGA